MKTTTRTAILCLAIAGISVAAAPSGKKQLTPERIAELTAPTEGAATAKGYKIEISALGSATLPAAKLAGEVQSIREYRFPTEFEPPQAATNDVPVVPTTPTAFETVNTGWTVRLTAKPRGKLIAVYGVADYVEAEIVPGGYGAIAGPIHNDRGQLVTPNKLDQPKVQTTTTRFHIFALPGEPYEVTLFRGNKREKHTVTVTAE
jgi:hypothetical protein